ncbi:FimD/PapC N-terminal domain-containing protein [Escherichia coli]|uniref:FimD/PapC N-terminal domain-containing protein n=1 Tax=Escherichia coli TaxID=562 RepID=UPI003EE3B3FB
MPFFFCADVAARSYTFEPSMLNVDGNDIDLSIFESGAQLPGTYYVDIMLNGKLVDTKEMEFSRERNKDGEFVLSSISTHLPCSRITFLLIGRSYYLHHNQLLFSTESYQLKNLEY